MTSKQKGRQGLDVGCFVQQEIGQIQVKLKIFINLYNS